MGSCWVGILDSNWSTSLYNYMASTGNLNRRLGSRSIHSAIPFLEAFWKAYKVCHPDFSLYYREDVDLGSCIPVYIYADGGRGLEKTELMVFNWSSAVGYGSGKQRASRRKFGRGRSNHPQVNLIGHSYTNRNHFLRAVMPHKWQRWFEIPCYVGLFRWRPLPELQGRDQSWKPLFSPCGVGIEGGLQVASSCREVYPMVHHLQEIRLWSKQRKTNHWLLLLALPCWSYQLSYYPFEEIHTERSRWLEVIDEFALVEECGLLVRSFPYIAHPAKFYLPDLFQSISYILSWVWSRSWGKLFGLHAWDHLWWVKCWCPTWVLERGVEVWQTDASCHYSHLQLHPFGSEFFGWDNDLSNWNVEQSQWYCENFGVHFVYVWPVYRKNSTWQHAAIHPRFLSSPWGLHEMPLQRWFFVVTCVKC